MVQHYHEIISGPINKRRQIRPGVNTLLPEEYVPVFKSLGVTCIVRFNSKCYDRNVYLAAKIRHVDLYYEDGANPPESILQAFLQLCEGEKGVIAVHCKAGLGRTGTNIAAYMIKHYGYTAKESTAWCRVCRPGRTVGHLMAMITRQHPYSNFIPHPMIILLHQVIHGWISYLINSSIHPLIDLLPNSSKDKNN